MKTAAVRLAFALFAATLLCSCEKDKARDKWEDAKEKAGASDENAADVTAAGTWTGTSGKDGAKTVLVLTDKSGDVSGTATWPASGSTNAVSVSGTRTARNAMLYVDGDWWRLAIKGDKMWGSGEDAKSHDSYNLSFVR
jgi:hypothetical protein